MTERRWACLDIQDEMEAFYALAGDALMQPEGKAAIASALVADNSTARDVALMVAVIQQVHLALWVRPECAEQAREVGTLAKQLKAAYREASPHLCESGAPACRKGKPRGPAKRKGRKR